MVNTGRSCESGEQITQMLVSALANDMAKNKTSELVAMLSVVAPCMTLMVTGNKTPGLVRVIEAMQP